MLAAPTPAEREVLGAIPYQRNEAVLHTDARLMPRRRQAWASWNYHLADEPSRAHDRHLRHEPPAVARRATATSWSRSTAPRRSTRRSSSARSTTPTRSTRRGRSPRRSAGRRSAGATGSTTAAPTGAGASTRTAPGARCAPRQMRRRRRRRRADRTRELALAGMTRVGALRGLVSHRRPDPVEHAFRYRVFLPLLDLDELPGAFDRHPALVGPAPGPGALPPLGLPRATRAPARRRGPRPGRRAHRPPPRRPGPAADDAALLGARLQPGQLLLPRTAATGLVLTAVIAEVTNTPWGERHSYVLEAAARTAARGELRASACTSRPSCRWSRPTMAGRASPASALGVSIASEQEGGQVFEASLGLRRHPRRGAR